MGPEIARELARRGHDVVAIAEDAGLDAAVSELRTTGSDVRALRADLTSHDDVVTAARQVGALGRPVDVLVLNAGVGEGGAFVGGTDLDRELALVDLNVRSTVHLAKLLVAPMVAAGRGRVLFTSSIASTMPGSFQAVYAASKSFVQSFALALRDELRGTGVTVTTLMPGPTDTRFFERAGMQGTRVDEGPKDDPAAVASQAVDAALDGRDRVVTASMLTKAQSTVSRLLPDAVKARVHRWISTGAREQTSPTRS